MYPKNCFELRCIDHFIIESLTSESNRVGAKRFLVIDIIG